jgi:23S rRNA U2552 (ribose-2'-O)-methylase RlmE/FtsJ
VYLEDSHVHAGDIRNKHNIEAFWAHCGEWFQERSLNGAMLVTADGSVDTQENPNEQEAMLASLIYAQFVTAIGLLADGGSLYLKCFATLEHSSISLLYACGSMFDKVRYHGQSIICFVVDWNMSLLVQLQLPVEHKRR